MARPNWEYIRVDVRLPRHRKLDGARRDVKWTLVELWAYCGEELTDGFVRDAVWKTIGTPAIRQQIIDRGFAGRVRGGYVMHDYLEHQRSREEVEALRRKRSESGRKGGQAKANAVALAKQTPEHLVQQTPERLPPLATASKRSKKLAEAEAEAEAEDTIGADVVTTSVEGAQPLAQLPTSPWLNGSSSELPPASRDFEAERSRQLEALAQWQRDHPEVTA